MKKVTPILFASAILAMVFFPSMVFAAWWNPLSWKIFNKKEEVKNLEIQQIEQNDQVTPIAEVVVPVNLEPVEKAIESTAKVTESQPVKQEARVNMINKVALNLPVVKPEGTVSEGDKNKIASVVYGFMTAVSKKDGDTANNFVSDKSKIYFDVILNTARTATKEELLKKDFFTIATVMMVRLDPTSSTLEIKGSDIITQAVAIGNSTWLSSPNFYDLGLSFKWIDDDTVFVSSEKGGDINVNVTLIREKGSWKIDYVPSIENENAIIEKELLRAARTTGKTREEIMETTLQSFLGKFNAELDYRLWVPLNKRGELNVDNAKLTRFSSSINGWSILFPNYWTIEFSESTIFFMAPYTTDGFRPSVAITSNHEPVSTNLDKYFDYFLEELPKVKKDVVVESIESEKTTFKGMPAYHVVYSRLRTFDEGRTYIKQISDSIVVLNEGIAYLIEYRNGVADFDKTKPLADKIIKTFRFEEVCTKNCIIPERLDESM